MNTNSLVIRAVALTGLSGLLLQPLAAQGISQMLASRSTDMLTKSLKLSPDVAKQIASINESFMGKFSGAKGNPGNMLNVFKDRDKALKSALSPDQWKTLQADRVGKASEMQTAIMANELDLSESQIDQVSKVNLDSIKEVQDAGSLSGAEKADKLKSIQASKMDSLSRIFNPDQLKNWQSFTQGAGKDLMSKGLGKFVKVPGL